MPFRRTLSIVTDTATGDAKKEADVIMTAAALGFAASFVKDDQPVQFDMDPLDLGHPEWSEPFQRAVQKIDTAIAEYLNAHHLEPRGKVHAGLAPGYTKGAVIVGVYKLAGQLAPPSISAPALSPKGQVLYDKIKNNDPSIVQYTGRGGYTGFVDNKNTVENTDPVGPRPTARFLAPSLPTLHRAGLRPRAGPPGPPGGGRGPKALTCREGSAWETLRARTPCRPIRRERRTCRTRRPSR